MCLREKPPLQLPADRLLVKTSSFLQDHDNHLPAVDRFEGNTKGKVAVFGLLDTAGLPLDVSVGNPVLVFAQKVNAFLDFDGTSAKAYSKPEDVPSWWKSGAVGGEVNDV